MMAVFRALIHTVKVHMGLSIARPMFKFIIWISPLLFSTIGMLIYGEAGPQRILAYVVLGSGFMSLWSSIVYSSASDINRERFYGTLELLIVSPVSFAIVLTGKILANTVWGLLSMGISVAYLVLIFRVKLPIYRPWLLLLSILTVLIAISVFSFFLSLAFTLSRQAEALMNFIEYPIYLICGFMFPISALPVWIKPISYLLPPTWSIDLLRKVTAVQTSTANILETIVILVLVTIGYYCLSAVCYRQVEKKVRISGQMGVY